MTLTKSGAGLSDLDGVDIDSESELKEVLLQERRAEFAFEGHYWFDLIRYNQFESVLGLETFRRRLPIPQRETNLPGNLVVQNPEY